MCMGQFSSVIYRPSGVAACAKRECMGIEPTGSLVQPPPLVLKTNTESTQTAFNEDHTGNATNVLARCLAILNTKYSHLASVLTVWPILDRPIRAALQALAASAVPSSQD